MCDSFAKENKPALPQAKSNKNQQPGKRYRTTLTSFQKLHLESTFASAKYPEYRALEELSRRIELPYKKVLVWFKNRRAKDKRVRKVDYGPYDFAKAPADRLAGVESVGDVDIGRACSTQYQTGVAYSPQAYASPMQRHFSQQPEPPYFPSNFADACSPPTPEFPPPSLFLPQLQPPDSGVCSNASPPDCPQQRRLFISDFISVNNSNTPMMQSRMA